MREHIIGLVLLGALLCAALPAQGGWLITEDDEQSLLSEGKIVLQGTQQEFLNSDHEKVRAFLERDFENRPIPA